MNRWNGRLDPETIYSETFRVYVDDGVLRTDQVLRLWSATALRFHHELTPAP